MDECIGSLCSKIRDIHLDLINQEKNELLGVHGPMKSDIVESPVMGYR